MLSQEHTGSIPNRITVQSLGSKIVAILPLHRIPRIERLLHLTNTIDNNPGDRPRHPAAKIIDRHSCRKRHDVT